MPRHVRDASLETRTARARLRVAHKPYFRLIEPGLHLGFRKLPAGPGTWVLRRYLGGGAYATENLRTPAGEVTIADDFGDADGIHTLSFAQAQDRARERVRALAETDALDPTLTVAGAVTAYVSALERRKAADRGGQAFERDARSRMKHVDETLAATLLARLTADDLIRWQERALTGMAPGSAQRVTNDLKAALNVAAKRSKAQLPLDFRETIRDGLSRRTNAGPAVAREFQVLPDADIRRIVAAAWDIDSEGEWGGDLARLVITLAACGARFSQVTRTRVADVQPAQKRLMIPVSRKGKGVKQTSHVGVRVGDDVLAALAPAMAGRRGVELLFVRPHRVGERGPWRSSNQFTKVWRAVARRAGLPDTTVAYCLRHSSIVRGLRAGLPVQFVAKQHDTSAVIIERHYAAFIVDAMDELAARAVIPLTTPPATVVPLAGRTK